MDSGVINFTFITLRIFYLLKIFYGLFFHLFNLVNIKNVCFNDKATHFSNFSNIL